MTNDPINTDDRDGQHQAIPVRSDVVGQVAESTARPSVDSRDNDRNGFVEAETSVSKLADDLNDLRHRAVIDRLVDASQPIDRWLGRFSEWCSPILVKEVRQALQSRQFIWTFLLLLVCIAMWTMFAILSLMPAIYFHPSGKSLLLGYFLLLIFPTILVVPNAAYRSMASELEQGTFDVLTLTPLSPLRIVLGKLAVAMVQIGIYFAAITPCMAMTYQLRGVSLDSIGVILGWVFITAIFLSAFGILVAGGNRQGNYGTILSIFVILVCFGAIGILTSVYGGVIGGEFYVPNMIIFLSSAGCWTVILGYTVLILLIASGAIGIAGVNYSSRIRWCLLVLSWLGLICAGIGFYFEYQNDAPGYSITPDLVSGLTLVWATHWSIAGMFLISERVEVSPKALRTFPSSLPARVFLTWFNPGSGTGYVFTLLAFLGTAGGLSVSAAMRGFTDRQVTLQFLTILIIAMYMALYLGLARLLLLVTDVFPKAIGNRMLIGPLIAVLLLLAGTFVPLFISGATNGNGEPSYEWYTIFNPFWSMTDEYVNVLPEFWIILGIPTLIVFSLNFALLSRDVMLLRIDAPPLLRKPELAVKEVPVWDSDPATELS